MLQANAPAAAPAAAAPQQASQLPPQAAKDMKKMFFYLFFQTFAYGTILIAAPALMKRIYGGDDVPPNEDANKNAALFNGYTNGGAALLQFFSNPWMGMMSDKFGRKPFAAIASLGLTAVMLAVAIGQNFTAFIVATVVRGLTDDSFTMSAAVVGDVAPDDMFGKLFGALGGMQGLGVLLGPILGIIALNGGTNYAGPFLAAAICGIINVFYVVFGLRETHSRSINRNASSSSENPVLVASAPSAPAQHERRDSVDLAVSSAAVRSANPFKALKLLRRNNFMTLLALAMFISNTSAAGMITIWYLYTDRRYHSSDTMSSALLFSFGISSVISQIFLLPRSLPEHKLGERKTVFVGFATHIAAMLLFAACTEAWMMFIVFVITMTGFFINPAIRGAITAEVPPKEHGALQGAIACVNSMASVVGPPLMAGFYYAWIDVFVGGVFLCAAGLNVIAALVAVRAYSHHSEQRNTAAGGSKMMRSGAAGAGGAEGAAAAGYKDNNGAAVQLGSLPNATQRLDVAAASALSTNGSGSSASASVAVGVGGGAAAAPAASAAPAETQLQDEPVQVINLHADDNGGEPTFH